MRLTGDQKIEKLRKKNFGVNLGRSRLVVENPDYRSNFFKTNEVTDFIGFIS